MSSQALPKSPTPGQQVPADPARGATPAVSTARLAARVSPELHALVKRAAEIQGRTVTDFVVSVVQDAAQGVIEQAEVMRLSRVDQEAFAAALMSPPGPSASLERAYERRRQLLRPE